MRWERVRVLRCPHLYEPLLSLCLCLSVYSRLLGSMSTPMNRDVQHTEAASEKYEVRCSEASQTIEALKVRRGWAGGGGVSLHLKFSPTLTPILCEGI